ncbi:rhodanese-like domain-containing protein [Crassaminicella profunda]|uniref:rhodanese-like domain-containing protein n=1 Tax=Crassaminicella profunda TaxID=1286698 RepID=UPI001FEABB57|nr:rhodanese-like domain-containing protein [Crassaminicella profunda]
MLDKNKRWITVAILLLITVILMACQGNGEIKSENEKVSIQDTSYQTITPADAKDRIEKEEGIILLDVRTKEEYKEKHIPNSIQIAVDDLEEKVEEKIPDKNATIFVYCRSGRRSRIASEKLIEKGYTNVFDLGGIIDWPYETEKE